MKKVYYYANEEFLYVEKVHLLAETEILGHDHNDCFCASLSRDNEYIRTQIITSDLLFEKESDARNYLKSTILDNIKSAEAKIIHLKKVVKNIDNYRRYKKA